VISVILNTAAGGGKNEDMPARLTELFAAAGLSIRIVPLASAADAALIVRRAGEEGDDAVVAAGGDGTISTVAAALAGSEMPLGVLPFGTLNHFAKDAGIPLDTEKAVKTIAARRTIKVDVGEVNDRTFLNNSSIGIYPDIVMQREALRRQGYWKWTALAVASATILRNHRGLVVKITSDNGDETSRTPFLFVGNNQYQAEGLHLGGRSRLDSGRLYAYLAPRIHARELPRLLALALAGRATETRSFESFTARELRVETPEKRSLRVALDGEVVVMATPLHYRVRPLALRLIVP
jgi:YegS/Rv2252/BmrU family lipid kinase